MRAVCTMVMLDIFVYTRHKLQSVASDEVISQLGREKFAFKIERPSFSDFSLSEKLGDATKIQDCLQWVGFGNRRSAASPRGCKIYIQLGDRSVKGFYSYRFVDQQAIDKAIALSIAFSKDFYCKLANTQTLSRRRWQMSDRRVARRLHWKLCLSDSEGWLNVFVYYNGGRRAERSSLATKMSSGN